MCNVMLVNQWMLSSPCGSLPTGVLRVEASQQTGVLRVEAPQQTGVLRRVLHPRVLVLTCQYNVRGGGSVAT